MTNSFGDKLLNLARDLRLFNNKKVLKQVKQGIQDSADGKVKYRGKFNNARTKKR